LNPVSVRESVGVYNLLRLLVLNRQRKKSHFQRLWPEVEKTFTKYFLVIKHSDDFSFDRVSDEKPRGRRGVPSCLSSCQLPAAAAAAAAAFCIFPTTLPDASTAATADAIHCNRPPSFALMIGFSLSAARCAPTI
jgi:hypothetical protein